MTARRIVLGIVVIITAILISCSSEEKRQADSIRAAFEAAAPQPDWWERVSTDVEILTYDDLLTYWQNDDRSKNQFFKAAYQAVLDYPLDTDLVVNAISLLPHGDSAYPYTTDMLEFAIAHYFDYQRPLNNYLGKRGDTVAGIARKLARLYNSAGDYDYTIELVERLLDARETEINDQLLELLSLTYAEALYQSGREDDAVAALQAAIQKYNGDWEARLNESLAAYRTAR